MCFKFNKGIHCNFEYTLFWRKFKNVMIYAFLVLIFGAEISVCAISYAFSMSEYVALMSCGIGTILMSCCVPRVGKALSGWSYI